MNNASRRMQLISKYKSCIIEALSMLIKLDSELIKLKPKEECINHKLAQYIEQVLIDKSLLGDCCVDIEYDKYYQCKKPLTGDRYIRPDVIVHKRNSGSNDNLIVIEAKKAYGSKDDNNKVNYLVKSAMYNYRLGAIVAYLPNKEYCKIRFVTSFKITNYILSKTDLGVREVAR